MYTENIESGYIANVESEIISTKGSGNINNIILSFYEYSVLLNDITNGNTY